ncbi:hypothetical protein IMSHALPRED_008346 [Imshaugia aleurites]|uniref:Uncharacterized protein n=1 Tax=Imshaugia aleurites TaxID=172621 RepID=A0A8H3FXI1_9LECA|nr:hypothetical protein IMSHALPRED_008346 [Imshaugia aleurites]
MASIGKPESSQEISNTIPVKRRQKAHAKPAKKRKLNQEDLEIGYRELNTAIVAQLLQAQLDSPRQTELQQRQHAGANEALLNAQESIRRLKVEVHEASTEIYKLSKALQAKQDQADLHQRQHASANKDLATSKDSIRRLELEIDELKATNQSLKAAVGNTAKLTQPLLRPQEENSKHTHIRSHQCARKRTHDSLEDDGLDEDVVEEEGTRPVGTQTSTIRPPDGPAFKKLDHDRKELQEDLANTQDVHLFEGVLEGNKVLLRAQAFRSEHKVLVVIEKDDDIRVNWCESFDKCTIVLRDWEWYLYLENERQVDRLEVRLDDVVIYDLRQWLRARWLDTADGYIADV